MKTDVFKINGMYCPKCPAQIADAVRTVGGVAHSEVDYHAGELRVEYDDWTTNRVRIADAVRRTGFTAQIALVQHAHGNGVSPGGMRVSRAAERARAMMRRKRCCCC